MSQVEGISARNDEKGGDRRERSGRRKVLEGRGHRARAAEARNQERTCA